MKRGMVVFVCLSTCIACSRANTDSGGSANDAAVLKPTAVAQIEALIAEKAARTPAQMKISSNLLYAKNGMPAGILEAVKRPGFKSLLQSDAAGRVLVEVRGAIGADLLGQIASMGGKVVYNSPEHGSARAWLPLEQIEALAANPAVTAVRAARPALTRRMIVQQKPGASQRAALRQQTVKEALRALATSRPSPKALDDATANVGAANSEGNQAHGADRARKYFGVDGTGVKVGVLSDSDDFKENSIATGDLPPDEVTVPGQDGRPGNGEGTAMMEIVHDLAPGAKLFFASAFNGEDSFADNIRTLRFTYGCDVIIDDVIYYDENPYQDDVIAQAVADVTASGGFYFSSAGNEGNFDNGTSGTWEGDFKGGGTLATLPSGYTVHNFGAGVISNRLEVEGGPLVLQWSDPGTVDVPASANDYDLFLLDDQLREVVLASTDVQNGTGQNFEWLPFLIPPGYRAVIAKHATAATRVVRLALYGGELSLATTGATFGHSAVEDAFSVAAVDVATASGGEFSGGPTTQMELFSADGPRPVFYDRNGHKLNGGVTFASGGGVVRNKPDLTAADGVTTTLPSFTFLNPFFGTSAAAPHAGAIAALIKSAVPKINGDKMRKAMINGSIDIMATGKDRDSGAGIVSAFNALQAAGAQPAVFLELAQVTVTGSSGGFVFPGGSGQISVTLVNTGGLNAGVVKGTLSSATPGVTITQAAANYPNIPPGGTGTNATPFAFTLDSSAPCGAKISFQLSVSFVGKGTNPTVLAFGVQTGRPSTTPTVASFVGAAAIPDDDPAGVDVPITMAGAGNLSSVTFSINGSTCTSSAGATTVGLDHTFVGDLVATLTSPAGTTVTLFNRPGGTGNGGNNFCQTVLADGAANSIQAITSSGAPWTGTFAPASPLSAFDGESGDGTWVLNVSDNAFIDVGSVRDVSISATGFSCP